ncbi:MAG: DUF4861 domain-containing protein, partial [Alistipes sp.]|nr:DUF4861 domain-containing protein [Alistipes sp.]
MKRILLLALASCTLCSFGRSEARTPKKRTHVYRVTVDGWRRDCPVVIPDVPAWAQSAVVTSSDGEIASQLDRELDELSFV